MVTEIKTTRMLGRFPIWPTRRRVLEDGGEFVETGTYMDYHCISVQQVDGKTHVGSITLTAGQRIEENIVKEIGHTRVRIRNI